MGGRTLKWLKVKEAKYREEERGFYRNSQLFTPNLIAVWMDDRDDARAFDFAFQRG